MTSQNMPELAKSLVDCFYTFIRLLLYFYSAFYPCSTMVPCKFVSAIEYKIEM